MPNVNDLLKGTGALGKVPGASSGVDDKTGAAGIKEALAVGTENADMPTGLIEVYATGIEVLGQAAELPLPVFGEPDYPEDIRLKYRFLDLRRETLHKNIMTRTRIVASLRHRMNEIGFNAVSYTHPPLPPTYSV